jgi:hypothetical protein
MEMSGQIHAPGRFTPRENALVPTEKEATSAPVSVWTLAGIDYLISRLSNLQLIRYSEISGLVYYLLLLLLLLLADDSGGKCPRCVWPLAARNSRIVDFISGPSTRTAYLHVALSPETVIPAIPPNVFET